MSIVIAIKHKNKIYLGCDSQVTQGSNKTSLPPQHTKVFPLNSHHEVIVGAVGSLRDAQIIAVEDGIIDDRTIYRGEINFDYMVKETFSNIYTILAKYNRIAKDKNGNLENYIDDNFIFAFKDKAWLLTQEGCVFEIKDYLVCGSGSDVAKGSLDLTKDIKNPIDRIKAAIKACADNTLYVDSNVTILTT